MTTDPSIHEPKPCEQALAESEQRYERLLAAASDYLFSVNLDHGVSSTKHGAGCEAVTGYSPAEYSNDPYLWFRVIHDEDRAAVLAQIDLILHDKIPAAPLEHRITHKNGSVRWIRNITIPRRNNRGQLLGYDGLITDITERKRAEERIAQLHRAQALLAGVDRAIVRIPDRQQLLDQICRVAVEVGGFKLAWIGVMAPDGSVQPVAKAGVTGYLDGVCVVIRDEPEGRGPIGIAIRENRPAVIEDAAHDSHMAPWHDRLPKFGLSYFGLSYCAAFPIQIQDKVVGSFQVYAPSAGFFDESELSLLTQLSKDISFALSAIEETAGRNRAEDALRESEARVRMATEAAGIAVWDWNVKSNALKWDEKMFEIYGLPPTPGGWVTYQDWANRVLPSELAEQAAQLQHTAETGGQSQREFHIVRASDQSTRMIQAAEMAVVGSDGQTVRVVGMNIDITERKEFEVRLLKANTKLIERGKALNQLVRCLQTSHRELKETQLQLIQSAKLESLGTLAAGVAHEVKNPLQTILLGLDYLGKRPAQPDENLSLVLGDMRDAVNRANNIILELLSLSANSDFHIAPTDPNDLIERALMLTKNLLTTSRITLQRELSPSLPSVPVDPPKLEQVLINIIINGIQAMKPGGTLTVRSRMVCVDESPASEPLFRKFKFGETLVLIEVQDTGHGLTETQALKAFDPFYTTKPVGIGTGLGLSVAKKIVEEHGGNIEIKNAPGGGAVVVIALKT